MYKTKKHKFTMKSLVKVIKLRSMISTLTDEEFNQFMIDILKKCGRNIFLPPLYDKFMENKCQKVLKNNCPNHKKQIDYALKIIRQIIRGRQKSNNIILLNQTKLDLLPKALIGEIASYLHFHEYINLTVLNRWLFISCNDPNTLRYLELEYIENISYIDLTIYSRLQKLGINLDKLNGLSSPSNINICNELKELILHGNEQPDVDIIKLKSQTVFNFNNITSLTLWSFGKWGKPFSYNTFIKILNLFPNIEYLDICGSIFDDITNNGQYLKPLLTKLKGFSSVSGNNNIANHVISQNEISLKALHLGVSEIRVLTNTKFDALQELLLVLPQIKQIHKILNKTHALKRMEINSITTFIEDLDGLKPYNS